MIKSGCSSDSHSQQLIEEIFDQNGSLYLNKLLDLIPAVYFECKTSKKKNLREFAKRYGDVAEKILNLRVKLDDFKPIKIIGKGTYGKVELVEHVHSNKQFALKTMQKNAVRKLGNCDFMHEKEILSLADSPFLVKLFYSFQDDVNLYLVMDYMQGSDLLKLISDYEFTEEWASFYLVELILGLEKLHSIGYIHRDIKSENALIDSNGHLKLCDFGTCISMSENGTATDTCPVGTIYYFAPELIEAKNRNYIYTRASDYWAIGILFFEILFAEVPFMEESQENTFELIKNYKNDTSWKEKLSEISPDCCDLMNGFLCDAGTRYGRNGLDLELRNHKFFAHRPWNWDNIHSVEAPQIRQEGEENEFNSRDSEILTNEGMSSMMTSQFIKSDNFDGQHLPFVGFTFDNTFDLASIKNYLVGITATSSTTDSNSSSVQEYVAKIDYLQNQVKSFEINLEKKQSEIIVMTEKVDSLEDSLKARLKEVSKLQIKILDLESKEVFSSQSQSVKGTVIKVDESDARAQESPDCQNPFSVRSFLDENQSDLTRKSDVKGNEDSVTLYEHYTKMKEQFEELYATLEEAHKSYNSMSYSTSSKSKLDSNSSQHWKDIYIKVKFQQMITLSTTVEFLNKLISDLKTKLSEVKYKYSQEKEECDNLKERLRSNQTALIESLNSNEELKEQIDILTNDLAKLRRDYEEECSASLIKTREMESENAKNELTIKELTVKLQNMTTLSEGYHKMMTTTTMMMEANEVPKKIPLAPQFGALIKPPLDSSLSVSAFRKRNLHNMTRKDVIMKGKEVTDLKMLLTRTNEEHALAMEHLNKEHEEYRKKINMQAVLLEQKDSEIKSLQTQLSDLLSKQLESIPENSCIQFGTLSSLVMKGRTQKGTILTKLYAKLKKESFVVYCDETETKIVFSILLNSIIVARPVTKADFPDVRQDIVSRGFQIVYENKDVVEDHAKKTTEFIMHKGHRFVLSKSTNVKAKSDGILFANCSVCTKELKTSFFVNLILRCENCNIGIHKDHYDKNDENIHDCIVKKDQVAFKTKSFFAEDSNTQSIWITQIMHSLRNIKRSPSLPTETSSLHVMKPKIGNSLSTDLPK